MISWNSLDPNPYRHFSGYTTPDGIVESKLLKFTIPSVFIFRDRSQPISSIALVSRRSTLQYNLFLIFFNKLLNKPYLGVYFKPRGFQ
ncbi:hypothetical protein [Roseofilum casamattae]|uniref:Uncharacterized protein n=1 Tax=Roseofilum casamattae BLCC-M143 TaxID=3022442 RepID=A0ABT7BWJ0_9CYAN|nr:hypothetical protein [Roseofilum casamattae]MDJ1182826.1 hypothetical protein [Roseofilum casamattae BLCC-M143]